MSIIFYGDYAAVCNSKVSERRELTVYQYALNFELVSVAKIPYSLLKLSFIIFFANVFLVTSV